MANHVFQEIGSSVIYHNNPYYDDVINQWAAFIKKQHRKGLIPLFITGLGVSKSKENEIPDVYGIVDKLEKEFDKDTEKKKKFPEIVELFETLKAIRKKKQKDRGTVARLLNTFQERKELREEWKSLNREWLLPAILNANPTPFHKALANFYESFDAVNITLNFDGLLIREFEINRKREKEKLEKAFSLPTKEECENFFLRPLGTKNTVKEYLEIQIRGDILYVECDAREFCPNKGKKHSLWAPIASYPASEKNGEKGKKLESDHFLKCPYCGNIGVSFLSFPGSYEKEKDMKDMLEIVWKYLAFRVGSVTVVGTSGEWDPLIIAFLGDLLSERGIPLLVVDIAPKENGGYKYIIKELVNTWIRDAKSVCVDAGQFMKDLTMKLKEKHKSQDNKDAIERKRTAVDDQYWQKKIKEAKENSLQAEFLNFMNDMFTLKFSELEDNVRIKVESKGIDKFAQLGLKSYWLGINRYSDKAKYHTRFNHSIGVMKVASYLYDKAIENAGLKKNDYEKQFLRLAALLHDVGHLPFSHLIENVFNELNWKPAGYKDHYSHVFQTDKEIEEVFSDNNLRVQLENTGYNVEDIIKLVNGSFGVEYLDAIINSSIDADKIDYVFRDTSSTERKTSLAPVQFLKDIVNGLSITPENYLSFSGVSAMAAVGLLSERQRLYRSLYLQPGIIILEGIVKLIIKTYFVHFISLNNDQIIKKMEPKNYDYPDLGDYKISYCVKELKRIFEEKKDGKDIELGIVEYMFERIKREKHNIIDQRFLENIGKGFMAIKNTKDEDQLKELEQKVMHKQLKGKEGKIREIARDVMFRMPGAAIIEISTLPKFLSSSDNRGKRERSDGTKVFSECILVPKNDYNAWNSNDKAAVTIHDSKLNDKRDEYVSVYLYPISGNTNNSDYKYACNLFDKLLSENSISEIK